MRKTRIEIPIIRCSCGGRLYPQGCSDIGIGVEELLNGVYECGSCGLLYSARIINRLQKEYENQNG